MTRVAIALGSNLGDRRATLLFAFDKLSTVISGLAMSDMIETDPEGEGLQDQPRFLNAVAVGETALDARELLDVLMGVEREVGRTRPFPGAARTLDLDLILFGGEITHTTDLQLPHPRFRTRFFVLGPLAEIAPDFLDPVTGSSVAELLRNLLRDETR